MYTLKKYKFIIFYVLFIILSKSSLKDSKYKIIGKIFLYIKIYFIYPLIQRKISSKLVSILLIIFIK
jgi:hypothetical protein